MGGVGVYRGNSCEFILMQSECSCSVASHIMIRLIVVHCHFRDTPLIASVRAMP